KERSIAFVTRPHFEVWHPLEEIEKGASGSEICAMRLAERLAERGWHPEIWGSPGRHEGYYNDVWYGNAVDFDPRERRDVVVSSRAPEVMEMMLDCDLRMLWMHDVNVWKMMMQGEWGPRALKADAIIALTPWHKHHL